MASIDFPILKTAIDGTEVHLPMFGRAIQDVYESWLSAVGEAVDSCETAEEAEALLAASGLPMFLTTPIDSGTFISIGNIVADLATPYIKEIFPDEMFPERLAFLINTYDYEDFNNNHSPGDGVGLASVLDEVIKYGLSYALPSNFLANFEETFASQIEPDSFGSASYTFSPAIVLNNITGSKGFNCSGIYTTNSDHAEYGEGELQISFQNNRMVYGISVVKQVDKTLLLPYDGPTVE